MRQACMEAFKLPCALCRLAGRAQSHCGKGVFLDRSQIGSTPGGRAVSSDGWGLDALAGESLWRQLHARLSVLLAQGQWQPGQTLPPERDLAVQLGISRITVKRCYDELRREGWLGRGSGRGGSTVQVAPVRVRAPLGQLKGFTQEMQELGKTPSTRVLSLATVQDRVMASLFERPSNAPFLHVLRLRFGDEVPLTRESAWYDLTLAPAMAHWNGLDSAYEFLRTRCGLTLMGAQQTVEAVLSTDEEARDFGLSQPLPCLLFKRKTHVGKQAQLAEYVEGLFRGDAYVYQMPLSV